MGEYSRHIHPQRRSVATPQALVGEDGQAVFGTFDKEFLDMDLLRAVHPTHAPQAFNKAKLTLWQEAEVDLGPGVLLIAVSDMGLFGKMLHLYWDKATGRLRSWDVTRPVRDVSIAPNLLDGARTLGSGPHCQVEYVNHYEQGQAAVTGRLQGRAGQLAYSLKLTNVSLPSIVSIPFGPNRPLYSQKNLFAASGWAELDGRRIDCGPQATAIIDDHRGYYPRRMHYDWLTAMGVRRTADGQAERFGFNLTRNQSLDQQRFNENLVWMAGRISLLPPVAFTREHATDPRRPANVWHVADEHDMVSIDYTVATHNAMVTHALVVDIDYYYTFGTLAGYVRDEDGTKIVLDGMVGLGEDKSMLF